MERGGEASSGGGRGVQYPHLGRLIGREIRLSPVGRAEALEVERGREGMRRWRTMPADEPDYLSQRSGHACRDAARCKPALLCCPR